MSPSIELMVAGSNGGIPAGGAAAAGGVLGQLELGLGQRLAIGGVALVQGRRPLVLLDGVAEIAERKVGEAEAAVGLGVVGVQADRLLAVLDRLLVLAQKALGRSAVAVVYGVLPVALDSLRVSLRRLAIALLGQLLIACERNRKETA